MMTNPFNVSNVSPTVFLASSRPLSYLSSSLVEEFPFFLIRSSDGFTSQKMGTTFFLHSIIKASSCKQKCDSQYFFEKTATPTRQPRIAGSIFSNSLSPGRIDLLSKNGLNPRLERCWKRRPAMVRFVSIPR